MKITDLVVTLFERQMPVVPRWAPEGGTATCGVMTIETDEGVSGSTFFGTPRGCEDLVPALLGTFKPLLLGRNPLSREAIWSDLWGRRQVALRLIGAIDVALWDLAGRAAGWPIHQLIGTCHEKIGVYVGNSGLPAKVDVYVDDALKQRAKGYRAYKLHSKGEPELDIAICTAVRKAVGDSYPLMFDLHARYPYGDAVRVGLVLQELGFEWYEDPMHDDDIYGYTRLKQQLHIPLLATEGAPKGPYGHDEWLVHKATDMLRGDVINKCGVTALLKVAHLAEMFRMPFEPHHFDHPCNNLATLNVMLAIPNSGMYEVNLPDEYFKYGMISDAEMDAEGFVHAPTGPGLGHEIDWEFIRHAKKAELR